MPQIESTVWNLEVYSGVIDLWLALFGIFFAYYRYVKILERHDGTSVANRECLSNFYFKVTKFTKRYNAAYFQKAKVHQMEHQTESSILALLPISLNFAIDPWTFLKNVASNESFFFNYPMPGFPKPATDIMLGIIDLHHDLMAFISLIFTFVLYMMASTLYFFYFKKNSWLKPTVPVVQSVALEVIWTFIPCVILFLISIPSFLLLYDMGLMPTPLLTLKIIGNQWYWIYEYGTIEPILLPYLESIKFEVESFPKDSESVYLGDLRVDEQLRPYSMSWAFEANKLFVDNILVLPCKTNIRLLITSTDVLHSWAVPSFGVKMDACPGRLNQVNLNINYIGIYYGQCSELCGINHSFMPICVQAVHPVKFASYLLLKWAIADAEA